MIRVLVTGAGGFLGWHCLAALQRPGVELHAVSRTPRTAAGVIWHQTDLRDAAQASALVARVRPSHLLHLAWEATPGRYQEAEDNFRWASASIALAEAFGQAGGRRFIGVGSSAEYAAITTPCVEDVTPLLPATIYGKCKLSAWFGIDAAAQRHGFAAVWGRVFLPYGPGDPAARLIPFVRAALAAGRPVETTHGRQQRDFIFAPDVAALLARLVFAEVAGVFNIGTGQASTVASVILHLADRLNAVDLVRLGARLPPPGEAPVLVASMEKTRRLLGWQAETSLTAGLDLVLAEQAAGAHMLERLS